MKKIVLQLPIFLFLISCKTKFPDGFKKYDGIVMDCRADSLTVFNDSIIKLKTVKDKPYSCKNCKYASCENLPEYFERAKHWPGMFTFKFQEKNYWYLHNPRPAVDGDLEGKQGIRYDLDFGYFDIDTKNKMLIYESIKFKVTNSYKYTYNSKEKILTLRLVKREFKKLE